MCITFLLYVYDFRRGAVDSRMGHGGATPARKGNLCSVVRCVRFVVGGAGWSACPAGGRKWKVNDAKTGNGILWIVGNRLPVPLLARAQPSIARPACMFMFFCSCCCFYFYLTVPTKRNPQRTQSGKETSQAKPSMGCWLQGSS